MTNSSIAIPILTYHGVNVDSDEYFRNDHIALHRDLRVIHESGKRVVSLEQSINWLLGECPDSEVENGVVINFDDGSWFDFYDLRHPTWGLQRSMLNILSDFHEETGAEVHATCFVIASPRAREQLDKTCLIGKGWWGDEWWQTAQESGFLSIENHSWDHIHPTLDAYKDLHPPRNFSHVVTEQEADFQILQAKEYIENQLPGKASKFFVYPCGDHNDYLVGSYLPGKGLANGIKAALSDGGKPLEKSCNRWKCPRYTCGFDWRSEEGLQTILGSV
jgi:hypothetical protein